MLKLVGKVFLVGAFTCIAGFVALCIIFGEEDRVQYGT